MFTATIQFENGDTRVIDNFKERHPAKSCAGWYFNQAGVKAVEVIENETGEIKLSLVKGETEKIDKK
jgi:hypothetical protein